MSFITPKIKIITLDDEKLIFRLNNSTISFANALRRVMIAEVPTLAIDVVEIEENTTCLHDQFITHRLGLIPITSSKIEDLTYNHECTCDKWCPKCSVKMSIDVVQTQNETKSVTTREIESQNKDFIPVDCLKSQGSGTTVGQQKNIVIVKINRGQKLKLDAIAKKGIGKMHAKWSPVSTVTFHYVPDIIINEEIANDLLEEEKIEWSKSCPSNIFKIKKDEIEIEEQSLELCTYCMECVEKASEMGRDGLVTVREKRGEQGTYNFTFTVESTGSLKPDKIFIMATEVLSKKMLSLQRELDKLGKDI